MASLRPERFENSESINNVDNEAAEVQIRALERTNVHKTKVADSTMTDKAGRPINLRNWENEGGIMVRAYDTSKVNVPERPDPGQAGHAEAHFDKSFDSQKRLRLNYIETNGEYRGTGIGGKMLQQVEEYAHNNGATEVYGVIENTDAQNFWKSQADNGWEIDYSQGAYGYARKTISS